MDKVVVQDLTFIKEQDFKFIKLYEHESCSGCILFLQPMNMLDLHVDYDKSNSLCFVDGVFYIYLLDSKNGVHEEFTAGSIDPKKIYIPPGIHYGYRNIGNKISYVLSFPVNYNNL